MDLATHDLDIMQHVLGHDMTRAYAEGARFAHLSQEDLLTDCVLDDLPEPVSAHDGARARAAALAVRHSAQEHRRIELMPIPAAPA